MKKIIYLLLTVFMVSCGSDSNSVYEKTITEYLLKGGDTKDNLNFKIVELTTQGTITVADSIAYLTDEFRKDKELIIKRIELAMQAKVMTKHTIAVMSNRIDSLKNLTPDNLKEYGSKNPTDILALTMRCKYSLTPPNGKSVEETFDFYLSPDGLKCLGKARAK